MRSDGSMVEVHTVGPVNQVVYVRTISLIDSSQLEISDNIKSKVTWPEAPEREAAARRARILQPPANCVFVGERLVNEHAAILDHNVVVVTFGDEAGHGPRMTMWKAPDLACTSLQSTVELPQLKGSYQLVSATKAVSLKLVEPDPSWFQGGEGYTELRPSAMTQKMSEQFCARNVQQACGAEASASDADADKRYDLLWSTHR